MGGLTQPQYTHFMPTGPCLCIAHLHWRWVLLYNAVELAHTKEPAIRQIGPRITNCEPSHPRCDCHQLIGNRVTTPYSPSSPMVLLPLTINRLPQRVLMRRGAHHPHIPTPLVKPSLLLVPSPVPGVRNRRARAGTPPANPLLASRKRNGSSSTTW